MLIKESFDFNPRSHQKAPISISDLTRLFNFISWYPIVFNQTNNTSINPFSEIYGNYSTLSIIKALILPFLINIPTERALARELEERGILQALCSFPPGEVPSRGTIWNFRRKYQKVYPEILIKILAIFGVYSIGTKLNLPYLFSYNNEEIIEGINKSEMVYTPQINNNTRPLNQSIVQIEWWQPPDKKSGHRDGEEYSNLVYKQKIEELHSARDWQEWEKIEYKYLEREKSWLCNDLSLPVFVKTVLSGGENEGKEIMLKIDAPEWLEVQSRDMDTIVGYGSSAIPHIACNILVFRERSGKEQVLMTKRLSGFGEGTYSLPGGKLMINETVEECAKRELKQETSISLNKSKPVSIKITHFPGKPWVISIGALAVEYEGKPRTIEKYQHGEWQWFDIEKLPEPLFEPTRIVISQYLSRIYPDLKWSNLEVIIKREIGQSPLFGVI